MDESAFLTKTFGIQFPRAADELEAYILRGHNMGLLRDGWVAFIAKSEKGSAHDGLVEELCVVRTTDDRTIIRFLKRGHRKDRWDLLTVSGPAELDVQLEWAAPVRWLRPNTISQEQMLALQDFADR